jgi:DNA polymerase-3 subunit alpha
MDDQEVFQMLSRGECSGVFQMSGYACKKICVEMGIKSFEDIVAIIALARPGPMQSGMTADYLSRKKTGRWERTPYQEYNDIVENTYGVLVYQEQVMRVFTDVAGMSAGLADKIRKVIGKKRDAAEFEPYRIQFIEGCQKHKTFTVKEAERFWAGLLEWASYGFNKAHAVEYSIIAYRTAWLKYHYPMEYLASFLTYGKEDQKVDVLQEVSRRINIQLVTPKIKYSLACKWAVDGDRLYMPFNAIKGIGEKDAVKCLTAKPVAQSNGSLAGFFNLPKVETKKELSKLQQLLEEVKAFDDDLKSAPLDFNQYFGCEYVVNQVQRVQPGVTAIPKRQMSRPVRPVTSRSRRG